jgi:ketosteroid isomerase-like protein
MPAHNPEQLHSLFVEAFNAADIEALMALYEPDACIEPEPGKIIEGAAGVRNALNGLLAVNGQISMQTRKAVQCRDLAVLHGDWSLAGTGPDGNRVTFGGQTTEVARQQTDGTWRFVIDLPVDL